MRHTENSKITQQQASIVQCINKKCLAILPTGAVYCPFCGRKQFSEPRKYRKRSHGTGTVYKLKGNRSRPWVAAQGRLILDYYETRKDAEIALSQFIGQKVPLKYNWTFIQVYEGWKAEHFRDLKSDKGIEGYETAFKHYTSLHNRIFRELEYADFQAPIDALIEKGRSHSTCAKLKQLIGQMCKWAIREKISSVNYGSTLKLPENTKKNKPLFTKEELEKIHSAAEYRDEAKLIEMMVGTGMRIGELFTLETDNIYEKYCIGGIKSEAGRNRIIPIVPQVRDWFTYFKRRAAGKKYLIEGYDGNRDVSNFRNREYYQLLDDLGISRKKTPHTCRRTFATMARRGGMIPELLQKVLGHADYATTANEYTFTDDDIRLLIRAVESAAINQNNALSEDDIDVEDLIGTETDS